MRPFCAFLIAIFAISTITLAQVAAPKLEFEVASVRPSDMSNPQQITAGLRIDGSQAHFNALSLKNLIARAYNVQPNLITGPDWISSQRYDISAKLPDGATPDQIPQMLQSLLADRFALKLHKESKDMPAYALIVGKSLKLQPLPPDSDPALGNGSVNVAVSGGVGGVSFDLGNGSSLTFANDQFQFKKATMDVVATGLSRFLDRPVVNMTDLSGKYDVTLNVTQEDYYILLVRSGSNAGVMLPAQAMALLNGSPVSLFDAIEQQGLHLDARKLPLDTIVVDSALQTPTQN
jgi:uncharacterized protein (TIGR03435 family)